MSEKKPRIEELQKRIEDIEKSAEKYKTELEETIRSRPLVSAGIVFVGGLVLGILIGTAVSRRS